MSEISREILSVGDLNRAIASSLEIHRESKKEDGDDCRKDEKWEIILYDVRQLHGKLMLLTVDKCLLTTVTFGLFPRGNAPHQPIYTGTRQFR